MSLTGEYVRIEVRFARPQGADLADCMKLVLNQMRASPEWDEPAGTGGLNYVCYDHELRITTAMIESA